MSRIVITTSGSLGDLFPYAAVAMGLRDRGHDVTLATNPCHQRRVESWNMRFAPVRPDMDWLNDAQKLRRLSHPRLGLLRVGREILMPHVRSAYDDIERAVEGSDLLVSMIAVYAARLVAEKKQLPWISVVHVPMGFFSVYDPPVFEIAPELSKKLHGLGRRFWSPLFWLSKRATRFLAAPWYRLRAEVGLPPTSEGNPIVDGHSPLLTLALFSPLLGERQPDWPSQSTTTGHPFFHDVGESLPPVLEAFLQSGPPPIVFTLGSAVSLLGDDFYQECLKCAQLLNRRAVLVVGYHGGQKLPPSTSDILAIDYAPYCELFHRAATAVHHGGIGTTAVAMRAGVPMLIVPCAWDQHDNAHRAWRLNVARVLPKAKFTAQRAATQLNALLENQAYTQRSQEVAAKMRQENGVEVACNAIEAVLARR